MRSNRYVSFLATEIEPKAFTNLSRFEQATENAFDRISRFNNTGAARLGVQVDQRSLRSLVQTQTALNGTRTQAERAAPALRTVARDSNAMATSLERSAQSLTVVQGALGPVAGRLSALGAIFRNLSGAALTGVLGGAGAFAIAGIASDYQRVTDRLRPFYETQQQTNSAMKEVIGLARETRQALDPVAALYSRLGQAAKDASLQIDQAGVARTVARAARLSGGDAQTQQAGITQFLQGFGSGTLNGDELKSIRENTFRLAKAIADGLGVPIARLKELGAEGKLTPAIIAEALKRSADSVDVEFSRLPLRIDQALQQASNNLSVFVGQLDQSVGATTGVAKGIALIGDNLDNTAVALAAFLALYTGRKLAGPIDAATAAISRQVAVTQQRRDERRQSNTYGTGGSFPPSSPEGIARAKASAAVVDAQSKLIDSRAEEAARRGAVAALDAEAVALKAKHAAMVQEAQDARASAAANVALARSRVDAATAGLAAIRDLNTQQAKIDADAARQRVNNVRREVEEAASVRAAAERRVSAARITGEKVTADPSLSRGNRNRQLATAAQAQALAEREVAAAMAIETAATERLVVAQNELAIARARAQPGAGAQRVSQAEVQAAGRLTDALGALTEATKQQATVERQAGAASREAEATGFKRLSIIEARVKAEAAARAAAIATANAEQVLTTRSIAAAAAQGVYERSLGAVSRAKAFATVASEKLAKASGALAGALGGPVGIALTAVTIGMGLLATQTDEARAAAQRFKDEQDAMAAKLGTTTAALQQQTAAARELRLSLAEAAVEESKKKRATAETQLGASLYGAATSGTFNLLTEQGRADAGYLMNASSDPSSLNLARLREIKKRNPQAFESNGLRALFGSDPGDSSVRAVGVLQTIREQRRAEKAVQDAQRDLTKPLPKLKPIDLTGGGGKTRETPEELRARASLRATGGTAAENARDQYNDTKAKLDAELDRRRKAGDYSFDDQYVAQLAAAESKLNSFTDAQRSNAAATRAAKKETREQTAALKEAEARGEKLADIMGRYSDEPKAVERGENAKREIDSFFVRIKDGVRTELPAIKVGEKLLTRADAELLKQRINDAIRKPITDLLQDQEREQQITTLILQGRENEAELLREKFRLIDAVGNLLPEEEASLARNMERQRGINKQIEERNRLIDRAARQIGDTQAAVKGLFSDGLNGNQDALKNFGERIKAAYNESIAEQLSNSLFGDAEARFREEMTRGLNRSADRLSTAADALETAAGSIEEASTGRDRGARSDGPMGDVGFDSELFPLLGTLQKIPSTIEEVLGPKEFPLEQSARGDEGEIVVIGKRVEKAASTVPASAIEVLNKMARDLARRLTGPNSALTRAAGKITGAAVGGYAAGSTIGSYFGKGGSQIGGGIGAIAGSVLGSQKMTQLSPYLAAYQIGQSIQQPIGKELGFNQTAVAIGGLPGGALAKLLGIGRTTRSGYASLGTDQYGNSSAAISGGQKSESRRAEALQYADGIMATLAGIADKFGGGLRSGLNLGTIGSQNDKFVFDPDGAGRAAGQKFDTFEEAQRAAIKNAFQKSVIEGIRAGTERLLQSGRDLETALDRAVSFENVFRDLKRRKDPVGAAIDELNTEFEKLIGIFNEAGASAKEFADLEELYGLRRAEAIKEAANASVESLQSFIDGLTASAESPLSRRTAYDNAKSNVDALRGDIAAGKIVDSDKLIDALTNFQNTSQALNGSRQPFYNDFEQIVALAKSAQANITAGQSTLPKSPFDPVVASDISKTATGVQAINDTLTRGLGDVVRAVNAASSGGSYQTNGSSFAFLPSVMAR